MPRTSSGVNPRLSSRTQRAMTTDYRVGFVQDVARWSFPPA
ncbi:hypothetical protein PF003_g18377 [Phytophthora fragariae]|nr:hypothetical protein PF003_g18377 [Phytophthora fragariae]